MADAVLSGRLWDALAALERPVSRDSIATLAKTLLPSKELTEFTKWMETHSGYLVGRLNGR
jgi:hypothetical protein